LVGFGHARAVIHNDYSDGVKVVIIVVVVVVVVAVLIVVRAT